MIKTRKPLTDHLEAIKQRLMNTPQSVEQAALRAKRQEKVEPMWRCR